MPPLTNRVRLVKRRKVLIIRIVVNYLHFMCVLTDLIDAALLCFLFTDI